MYRFSPCEKRMLKLMIVDCDVHHMTERESRFYINKRFGRPIARRTYYNYKNKVYSGENRRIRYKSKWIRGIHLSSLLDRMERTPLRLE